jgi:hypothetical protein
MVHSDWRQAYPKTNPIIAFSESLFLTFLGIALGYWLAPTFPFFTQNGLTWLMFGPLLSGLRYGFFYALCSVLLVLGILLLAQNYQFPWAQGSISTLGISLLLIAFVTGEFRNYWLRRIKTLHATVRYMDERLNELSTAFNIIKHSHDNLEQLVASQESLRNSIISVQKRIIMSNSPNRTLAEIGTVILRQFSDYGNIQEASLFEITNNAEYKSNPVAFIGNKVEIDMTDPLLNEAIKTAKTVSLKQEFISNNSHSLLLAVPIVDTFGKIWGIIAVSKMPFRDFSMDNFKLLSILSGYIGDLLGKRAHSISAGDGDEDVQIFMLQIERCIKNIAEYNLQSAIVILEFKNVPYYSKMSTYILERERGLDQSLARTHKNGTKLLFLLMPLTSAKDSEKRTLQIEQYFRETFAIKDFSESGISYLHQELSATDTAAEVMTFSGEHF